MVAASASVPAQSRYVVRAGRWRMATRVWRRRGGTGRRPVVLLHGLVVSSAYHVPLAEQLARRWTVHAPDLPGFGRSETPDAALDTRDLGGALIDWMDACGLSDAALVANSFGCQVAAESVLTRPDLVGKLVLLAPTMDPRTRRIPELLRRWRLEMRTQSPSLRRLMMRDYLRAGFGRAIGTVRHALDDRIEDKLPHLEVPTLVVRGTRDPIVDDRWATEVTRLLPDARLRRLPGATHAINHEMPLQTARVVAPHLEEPDPPTVGAASTTRTGPRARHDHRPSDDRPKDVLLR